MRFTIGRLIALTTLCAIGVFLINKFGDVRVGEQQRLLVYCFYLGFLALATVNSISSLAAWKRFWMTYAVFGWLYLFFVLRTNDPYTDREIPMWMKSQIATEIGIFCGFLCATLTLLLPNPIEREPKRDKLT